MDNNKTYRIRTDIGEDKVLNVKLDQSYDMFEILSLKLTQDNFYKQHKSDYGMIVGRVHTKNFGIPNAKISVFVPVSNDNNDPIKMGLYPFNTTQTKNRDGRRYNLLPDEEVGDCHQMIGSFPNKRFMLDNDVVLEVYDTYYKYTTRTNGSGDYMLMGIPTGTVTLHVDLDMSDIGILSQRPRDLIYKGYNITQFENANQFKTDINIDSLSQVFSQDASVYVYPFWGDTDEGDIAITRNDVEMQYKFEPTCVFMGSLVTDKAGNAIGKKCIATEKCGAMDELISSPGTIEMVRYTPDGVKEEVFIQGAKLIDGNGVWCYQIPMNLDYVMTDEFGNFVPTNDPEKGIATRARVRFRISADDTGDSAPNVWRGKMLVPHNPIFKDAAAANKAVESGWTGRMDILDYEFGTPTNENSFRDLLWNKVYTIKSYIPRLQKGNSDRNKRFTGIKHTNIFGANNPIPYNNIRIQMPFMFSVMCIIIKFIIKFSQFYNRFMQFVVGFVANIKIGGHKMDRWCASVAANFRCMVLPDGFCEEMEGWYYAPGCRNDSDGNKECEAGNCSGCMGHGVNCKSFLTHTHQDIVAGELDRPTDNDGTTTTSLYDSGSTEELNRDETGVCLTGEVTYLMQCVEIQLAQEYRVINFDFYNDWINGTTYLPQWLRNIRPKRRFLFGLISRKARIEACTVEETKYTRRITQQCAVDYRVDNNGVPTIVTKHGCDDNEKKEKCHKKIGRRKTWAFGVGDRIKEGVNKGGLILEKQNMLGQNIYYYKPAEWNSYNAGERRVLFATDIVLLGSLNDCDIHGIPQMFRYLSGTTYQIPTNLALTNMDDVGYLYSVSTTKYTKCGPGIISEIQGKYNTNTSMVRSTDNQSINASDDSGDRFDTDLVIPITEMSGIDWGYLGPGQTDNSYHAGGEFLGIACTNSQTNIKSCVNLTRACEVGVWLDQRLENPSSLNSNGTEIIYSDKTTLIPDGIISRDELNGSDVRAMFATLNHNNLRVVDDLESGLKKYDLTYFYPTNFDGSFATQINADTNINRKMEGYDNNYYDFRLGVVRKDGNVVIPGKYYYNDGNIKSFPLYENSFYFYFGLKEGSTAFDEFNKQYFAPCKTNRINRLLVDIKQTPGDLCETEPKNEIIVITNNAVLPITVELYNSNDERMPDGTEIGDGSQIMFENLDFGTYTCVVTDFDFNTRTETFTIGGESINATFGGLQSFIMATSDIDTTSISDLRMRLWEDAGDPGADKYGGYVIISSVTKGDETPLDIDGGGVFGILIKYDINNNVESFITSNNSIDISTLLDIPDGLTPDKRQTSYGPVWRNVPTGSHSIAFWGKGRYEVLFYQMCGNRPVGFPYSNGFNLTEPEPFRIYVNNELLISDIFGRFNTGFLPNNNLTGWSAISTLGSYDWGVDPIYNNDQTKELVIYLMKKYFYLDNLEGNRIKFNAMGGDTFNQRRQMFYEKEVPNEADLRNPTLGRPRVDENTEENDIVKPSLVSSSFTPTTDTKVSGVFRFDTQQNGATYWPNLKPPYFGMAYNKESITDTKPKGSSSSVVGETVPNLTNWFGVHILDKPFRAEATIWKGGQYYQYSSTSSERIPLTEVPIGFNFRGKTITIGRTDLTDFGPATSGLTDGYIHGTGGWTIVHMRHGETGSVFALSFGGDIYFYNSITGSTNWQITSYTFPSTSNLPIDINTLKPSTEPNVWGPQYAYVEGDSSSSGDPTPKTFPGRVTGTVFNGANVKNSSGTYEIGQCGVVVGGPNTAVAFPTDSSLYAYFNATAATIAQENSIETPRTLSLRAGQRIPNSVDGQYAVILQEANCPVQGGNYPVALQITKYFSTPNVMDMIGVSVENDCRNGTPKGIVRISSLLMSGDNNFYMVSANGGVKHPYFGTNSGNSNLFDDRTIEDWDNMSDGDAEKIETDLWEKVMVGETNNLFYLVSLTTENVTDSVPELKPSNIMLGSFSNMYDFSNIRASVSGTAITFNSGNWYLNTFPCEVTLLNGDAKYRTITLTTRLLTNNVGTITINSSDIGRFDNIKIKDKINVEHYCQMLA